MARRRSEHPTELELEFLHVLWRDGASTARQVQLALADSRKLAKTSVHTVLKIMERKGLVRRESRRKSQGSNLFIPLYTQQHTSRIMVRDLLRRVFHGSATAMLLSLFGEHKVSLRELQSLQKLARRKSKEEDQ